MAYLGAYFLQIWGVGVVRIIFTLGHATKSSGLPGDNKKDKNRFFGTLRTHVLGGLRWLEVA